MQVTKTNGNHDLSYPRLSWYYLHDFLSSPLSFLELYLYCSLDFPLSSSYDPLLVFSIHSSFFHCLTNKIPKLRNTVIVHPPPMITTSLSTQWSPFPWGNIDHIAATYADAINNVEINLTLCVATINFIIVCLLNRITLTRTSTIPRERKSDIMLQIKNTLKDSFLPNNAFPFP